jgi:hypothetical protein
MAQKRSAREPKHQKGETRLGRRTHTDLIGLAEKTSAKMLAGIFLFHITGLIFLCTAVTGLTNNQPFIDQDWGLHFHHLKSLEVFWRENGRFWGYNPSFMAGYPANTIQDLSIKFFEFVALGLSTVALSPVQWFKITAFLAVASVPFFMYFSTRNFFYDLESKAPIAVVAAFLSTAYWWNSLPREMFFYGMIGFPVAAFVSVWGVSLFYRLVMASPKPGLIHVGWLSFAAIIMPLHVQSLVIFMPAMIVLLIIQWQQVNGRLFYWMVAALAICLLANFVWLLPAFQHRHDNVSSAIVKQLPIFASSDPFTFLIDYLGVKGYWTFRPSFVEKGFRLALLILGLCGTRNLIKNDHRTVGIVLAIGLAVLFLLTYFGALISAVAAWQPLRFKVPLDLLLVVGAAFCVNQWFSGRQTFRFYFVPAMLVMGGLALTINVAQTESTGRLHLRTVMLPEITAIVDWVRRETPREARLLFEESGDETGFVYDGMYLSSFVPYLTGRQLIGGPINLYNDRHHFAEFHSGKLFQRDIETISDDELRNYLRLYNIGAVVAFHPASVKKLLSIPGLVTVDQRIGPIYLMKVNQPLNWFVEGEGKVDASAGRLELSDLKGREIVLKYHWVQGLNALPPVQIVPIQLGDDPIAFIKLIDPPSSVVLRTQ